MMCQGHIIITTLSEGNYDCTSQSEKDFLFESLQKHYFKSCVRHYCEKMCRIFAF